MQERNFPALNTQSARLAYFLAKRLKTRQQIAEKSEGNPITLDANDFWTEEDAEALINFENWLEAQQGTRKLPFPEEPDGTHSNL